MLLKLISAIEYLPQQGLQFSLNHARRKPLKVLLGQGEEILAQHPAVTAPCSVAKLNIACVFHRVDDLNGVGVAGLSDWQCLSVGFRIIAAASAGGIRLGFGCPAPAQGGRPFCHWILGTAPQVCGG